MLFSYILYCILFLINNKTTKNIANFKRFRYQKILYKYVNKFNPKITEIRIMLKDGNKIIKKYKLK